MSLHRISLLRQKLLELHLDGILLAASASMYYLLEQPQLWWQRDGGESDESAVGKPDCLLFVPSVGEPVLIAIPQKRPDFERCGINTVYIYRIFFDVALKEFVKGGNIALGARFNSFLTELLPNSRLSEGEKLVQEMRHFKDNSEIALMEDVARFTDEALKNTVPLLKPGITYEQVERHLIDFALSAGISDISFRPTVRFEKNSSNFGLYYTAHDADSYYGPNTPLEADSSISFDFGYVKSGYCSDFGRSFYLGKPPPQVAYAYKSLQEAQCLLIESICPNVTNARDMYPVIYHHIEKCGLERYLLNFNGIGMLAHQIGIDVHENPWIHNEMDFILRPGMIMCIEPKILIPKHCFMRVEDMVLITESGARSLTQFDRALYELAL